MPSFLKGKIMKLWFIQRRIQLSIIAVFFIFIDYLSYFFRFTASGNAVLGIRYLFEKPSLLLLAFPISLHPRDLLFASILSIMLFLFLLERQRNRKKFRKGQEHGSAQWGKPKQDLKGMYDSAEDENNIILSSETRLVLNDKGVRADLRRNKNVLVVGGSGSGKTRFVVKPNIMQMNADFVITDPKGTIINEVGYILKKKRNYKIKIFNLINLEKSMCYNPFSYIKDEKDILKVIDTIIRNTSPGTDNKEDFWVKAERLLYQAYIAVILEYFPEDERNLGTLVDLLQMSQTSMSDENYKNSIDLMFEEIEENAPDSFAAKQYRAYKLAAGETAKSILISCAARLSPINIPAVRNLLSKDELKLDKLGNDNRPNALFVIIPDTDPTFNFIISIMYSQMFNLLATIADEEYGGSMPRHIRFLLDEFANIGEIPNFDKLIATIRSRNISAMPILQALSQLKTIYKDNSETIIGNCDSFIFLGGKETSTVKSLSEWLGKETIDDYNISRTRSQSDSYGQNYSKLGRDLMTQDEILTMPSDECIVMIRGMSPFKDKKYDITKHPMYTYHGEFGGKYWFDVSTYLQKLRAKRKKTLKEEGENPNEESGQNDESQISNAEHVITAEEVFFSSDVNRVFQTSLSQVKDK